MCTVKPQARIVSQAHVPKAQQENHTTVSAKRSVGQITARFFECSLVGLEGDEEEAPQTHEDYQMVG